MKKNLGKSDGSDLVVERESLSMSLSRRARLQRVVANWFADSVTLVGSCEALEEVESHLIDGRPMIWNTAENLPTGMVLKHRNGNLSDFEVVAELVAHTMTSDDSARDLEAFPSSIEDESLDDSDIEGVGEKVQRMNRLGLIESSNRYTADGQRYSGDSG